MNTTLPPVISVLSYNPIWEYGTGVCLVEDTPVLFLPCAFNPKAPQSVHENDPSFRLLLEQRSDVERIIIFAGKKESGSLEIISLFATHFEREQLYFVLCDHDLEEKKARLQSFGIDPAQYVIFWDAHVKCQETPLLIGYLHSFVRNRP